jgi:D-alanyl-D-alanine carboxypeptidase
MFPVVRGSIVALALVVATVTAIVGLWVTWDSTQAPAPLSLTPASDLLAATTTSTIEATTTTTVPTPPCVLGDVPVEDDPAVDWATIVVDTERRLPPDFVPGDLVEVTAAGFGDRDLVRAFVIPDLAAFREALEANGTPVVVISAYRSYAYQENLFNQQIARAGPEQVVATTARAGHSEHQLGTTLDVLNPEDTGLTEAFADTPAGQWIAAHAHEYGFVLSYPRGQRHTSCHEFEPWHLRYVGRDLAARIHESGLSPREWLLRARAAAGG